jgi:uncharacterized protein YkwD
MHLRRGFCLLELVASIAFLGPVASLGGCGSGPSAEELSSAPAAETKSVSCYEGSDFACAAEAEIVRLTNEYRRSSGIEPLDECSHVGFVSRDWSKVQAARGSIGHDGFPSARNSVYYGEFGSYEGRTISGENVAMFYSASGETPERVAERLVTMWWNSSGHRANMLGNFAGIGAGIEVNANGGAFGTQIFYQRTN